MQRLRALLRVGGAHPDAALSRKDTGDDETESELARLVPDPAAAALRSRARSPTPRAARRHGDFADSSILHLRVRPPRVGRMRWLQAQLLVEMACCAPAAAAH